MIVASLKLPSRPVRRLGPAAFLQTVGVAEAFPTQREEVQPRAGRLHVHLPGLFLFML